MGQRAKILKPALFLALDVNSDKEALSLVEKTEGLVGGYKIGPRLSVKYGAALIQRISQSGQVFLDNKYYDIPNTMEFALRASFEAGASFATIHAGCGPEALEALAKVEQELNSQRAFKILAVTVLTSFSKNNRPSHWDLSQDPSQQVEILAKEAMTAGLSGLVCSPHEAASLKKLFPQAYLVTPGVRFPDEGLGDQKRVLGPREALASGASALVVGRPICDAKDPRAAAQKYFDAIQGV